MASSQTGHCDGRIYISTFYVGMVWEVVFIHLAISSPCLSSRNALTTLSFLVQILRPNYEAPMAQIINISKHLFCSVFIEPFLPSPSVSSANKGLRGQSIPSLYPPVTYCANLIDFHSCIGATWASTASSANMTYVHIQTDIMSVAISKHAVYVLVCQWQVSASFQCIEMHIHIYKVTNIKLRVFPVAHDFHQNTIVSTFSVRP